jgi:hypothetical protein
MEEQFGDSEHKQWIRRLYELGLIPRIPSEWEEFFPVCSTPARFP